MGQTLDNLEKRETAKGEFYFSVIEKKGQETGVLLKELLEGAITQLPWPKSMRWADHAKRWIRPIHSLLCIFDGNIVPLTYGPHIANRKTSAHRFLTSTMIEIKSFADYKKSLETGYVLIDPEDRKSKIRAEAEALAAADGSSLRDDPVLLDEVAGLVEWPLALMGNIDDDYMDIPTEVLTTTMRKNQKYFALETQEGELASKFIVVANKETPDGGAAIVAGNERVLRSRLADAKFFWDQDLRQSLESRLDQLKDITFHAKLGTLAEKVARLEKLAVEIAKIIGADRKQVARAGRLAKADLVTEMVREFSELQGVMGHYYALQDGESHEVARAIAEHYSPLGPSDKCPAEPVSVAVALADKIDTLIGFWAINETPSGSKDPFALRRAAIGVIRLILENDQHLSLMKIFTQAWKIGGYSGNEAESLGDLLSFLADRLKVYLREKGIRHDLISAVFSLRGEDDLVRLLARVDALGKFLASNDGSNLLTAYKRAANILRIEEKKDNKIYSDSDRVDVKLLNDKIELELFQKLIEIGPPIKNALDNENFAGAMSLLASTRNPVDRFFEKVTVNTDETMVRENRLKLLGLIRSSINQIADFSQIEGGER